MIEKMACAMRVDIVDLVDMVGPIKRRLPTLGPGGIGTN